MTASPARPSTLAADSPWREPVISRDGIIDAIGVLSGRNQIAAAFYDGPGWRRFRPWEKGFLTLQGGERRARGQILRHLPAHASGRLLEVGIGDGDNLPMLAEGCEVHGVDIARARLEACLRRFPAMAGRLAWAEGEALPYADGAFDACYSIGGFNYFGDHAAVLREMRRVTRPGGTLVVADESPRLHRWGLGHLIGVPALDAAWLRWMGLDRAFAAMVLETDPRLEDVFNEVWPGSARSAIWSGLGYCVVHR